MQPRRRRLLKQHESMETNPKTTTPPCFTRLLAPCPPFQTSLGSSGAVPTRRGVCCWIRSARGPARSTSSCWPTTLYVAAHTVPGRWVVAWPGCQPAAVTAVSHADRKWQQFSIGGSIGGSIGCSIGGSIGCIIGSSGGGSRESGPAGAAGKGACAHDAV